MHGIFNCGVERSGIESIACPTGRDTEGDFFKAARRRSRTIGFGSESFTIS